MKATKHSIDRAKQRLSINEAALTRTLPKILSDGIKHNQTKGRLNKYFTYLFMAHRNANNIRIYGEHVYIFCGENLLTMFPVPSEHKKSALKIQKRNNEEKE